MAHLRERLAAILRRLGLQRTELAKAEHRFRANRKRAFKDHREQLRYEADGARYEKEGHHRAAHRMEKAAGRCKLRAEKNHRRAVYWLHEAEAIQKHLKILNRDRKKVKAEIEKWNRKHPKSLQGVDWAWGDISATSLKKAGKRFACRYLSHDSGKNLTPSEAKALSKGGIDIVVVWESTGDRALQGHAAGVADAKDAYAQAKACGIPSHAPIFFAVDLEANPASLDGYFAGVASVLGKARCGPYGDDLVCGHLMDQGLRWAWQTYAWSGGRWEARAQIRQFSNDHTLAGVGVDYDCSTTADYGGWRSTL
jgi:Rv2525c-like, glycoside hydrolase-like domain